MTSLKIDNSSCKYTAKLLHTKSIFGKVYSTNNVLVSGFATTSDVKVSDTDGVISNKPICRKEVLKAVKEQYKCFV
jgi:hypothetical protein